MKTFMKFTLAVFVMLLAGAAAGTFDDLIAERHKGVTVRMPLGKFKAGCRALLRQTGYANLRKLRAELETDSVATKLKYNTAEWNGSSTNGLDDLLDSGCAWCAYNREEGYGCHNFAEELNTYIKFQKGEFTDKVGRITENNPFCEYTGCTGLQCVGMDDHQKGTCAEETGPHAMYGYQKLQVNGWGVPVTFRGHVLEDAEFCKDNQFTVNSDGHQSWTCTCKGKFPEGGVWNGPVNTDCGKDEKRIYKTAFSTIERADDCYTRGCSQTGYWSENSVSNFSDEEKAGIVRPEARQTIDAKGPAPVNQSKGFDGYQTALIVGLSVLSSFITAGSIYACRRLGEKSIELPGDVEGQNVAL